MWFKISLAEWSLNNSIWDKKLTNLDFPKVAKEEFGIDAIEYVNQFFKTEVDDPNYMEELKQRCEDVGVKSLIIMVDGEGKLGDADENKRKKRLKIIAAGSQLPSSWVATRFESMRHRQALMRSRSSWLRTVWRGCQNWGSNTV